MVAGRSRSTVAGGMGGGGGAGNFRDWSSSFAPPRRGHLSVHPQLLLVLVLIQSSQAGPVRLYSSNKYNHEILPTGRIKPETSLDSLVCLHVFLSPLFSLFSL